MKTIKVIDILVNIANGKEVPKKIIYNNRVYVYDKKVMDYYLNEESYLNSYNNDYYLFENELNYTGLCEGLNNEVEIIEDTPKEDKKIEHLDLEELNDLLRTDLSYNILFHDIHKMFVETKSTINEIIDKVNGKDNE